MTQTGSSRSASVSIGRFRIGHRIMAGFGVTMVLMAGVSGFLLHGSHRMQENLATSNRIARHTLLTSEIKNKSTDLRFLSNRYLDSLRADDLARQRAVAEDLNTLFAQADTAFPEGESRRMVQDIRDLTAGYLATFGRAAALSADREALLENRINARGIDLRRQLTALGEAAYAKGDFRASALAGQAQEDLLLARLRITRFIRSGSPDEAAGTRETLAELDRDMASLEAAGDDAAIAAIRQDYPVFTAAFEQLNGMVAAIGQERRQGLDVTGLALRNRLELLQQSSDRALSDLQEQVSAHGAAVQMWGGIVALCALVLALVLSWRIGSGIARPVTGMTAAMHALAEGRLDTDIPGAGRGDEIGDMAKAVHVFRDNAREAGRLAALERAEQAAKEARARRIDVLTSRFDATAVDFLTAVSSSSVQMQATAQQLTSTAGATSQRALTVSAASEQTSANVQTVATAAEELSGSIAEISRQVSETARIAREGAEQAASTNQTVTALAETADRIGSVVQLISSIAAQTNLLALNATIEAARAGEAGKGFAVVAAEVKNLARQTAEATGEISRHIRGMQAVSSTAAAAIATVTGTIARIDTIAAEIAGSVEQQSAATREIARNVHQAASGTDEVYRTIGSVTMAASETGAAATQVLSAAEQLSTQSGILKAEVESFLSDLRAA